MAVEFAPVPNRPRLASISWPAIFASLAVGISVMLLLTLAGVAVGESAVEPAAGSVQSISMGAAAWQAVSMLIAALVGGYVAARLSGLRRTADGVLHGAVSWGATTMLYAALATTALGTLTAGMFGLLAPAPPERSGSAASALAANDPAEAQRTLEGIGLTADQARTVIDKLSVAATPSVPAPAEPTGDTIGSATGWLAATVLISLLLSLLGGALGARGTRRGNGRGDPRDTASTEVTETPSPILSRQA